MLHGKKGFDRLVYASKQVLHQPLSWLFCNVDEKSESHFIIPIHPSNYMRLT